MTELKPVQKVNLLEKLNDLISSPLSVNEKPNLSIQAISCFEPIIEDSGSVLVETENELASTKLSNVLVLGTNRMIDQTNCSCSENQPCRAEKCPKNSSLKQRLIVDRIISKNHT
jgi:hypothetical protein